MRFERTKRKEALSPWEKQIADWTLPNRVFFNEENWKLNQDALSQKARRRAP